MNKNRIEWIVFTVSVMLIAVVAGLLVREQLTAGDRPADIVLTLGTPVASSQGHAVPIDVRNTGDTSAEDVHISVTLSGAQPETGDVSLPYLPYRSARRAWVMFSRDPGSGRLEARVLGYREP